MKNILLIIIFQLFITIGIVAQNFSGNDGFTKHDIILKQEKKSKSFKVTHSASQNIIPGNTASCNFQGQYHYENSYYLAYDLKNDFNLNGDWIVQRVEVAVEEASAGVNFEQPLTVKLWVMSSYNHNTIIQDSLTLLASDTVSVSDTESGTLKSIDFTSDFYTVSEGKVLVVEFLLPDGQDNGNLLFLGSNNDRISDSTYIKAPFCGINEPVNVSEILFPDMMIIANIYGEYASPNPQIQSFVVNGQLTDTEIKNEPDYTVKIIMPADTSLSEITPQIQIPAGFQITPASGETVDFSQGAVTYTVDNNFAKVSQSWDVSVVNAGPDITGANLPQINGDVVINGSPDFTVTIPVVEGSDLTSLSPYIYVYDGFVTTPESGSLQDFSSGAVTYTVSHSTLPLTQDWQVSVIETPATSSVKNPRPETVKIYPNPADDFVIVKCKGLQRTEVLDFSGKKLFHTSGKMINTSALPSGIYFLKIFTENKVLNKKIIIIH